MRISAFIIRTCDYSLRVVTAACVESLEFFTMVIHTTFTIFRVGVSEGRWHTIALVISSLDNFTLHNRTLATITTNPSDSPTLNMATIKHSETMEAIQFTIQSASGHRKHK